MRRTPGYVSWQGDTWLTHCNDAGAFLGDLPQAALAQIDVEALAALAREHRLSDEQWGRILEAYTPGGQLAVYVFECVRCNRKLYRMDYP
jgi:uncharacterized protein CbrC (UPF0167 family)